jgi:hypothetical protein
MRDEIMRRAQQRERVVRATESVRGILEELAPAEQADVLVELLAMLEKPSPQQAGESQLKLDEGSRETASAKPTAPAEPAGGRPPTRREHLLRLLREKPGRPIEEMAQLIYGDAGKSAKSNVRSMLSLLRKDQLVKPLEGRGKWGPA